MTKKEISIIPLFASPLMVIQLDLDLEKLIEFSFQLQNKDKKGVQFTNKGGWQSGDIGEEKHEEFIRLKKEIYQYLQAYQIKVFRGMRFEEENIRQEFHNMWININEKYHYNEWHIHPGATLSGVYYIKHDGSSENGNIMFKNPRGLYMALSHFPPGIVKYTNEVTSDIYNVNPQSNMLLIFPSWLEHKVEPNLKNDNRISLSFNSSLILEKKS
tara:strand:+ start:24 stop:665 length:642 start_codon:yes stop_codon:yes gene_type:complete